MSYVNKLFHGNRMKNIAKLKSCFVDRDGWRDCVCSEKWFKLSSKTKQKSGCFKVTISHLKELQLKKNT